MDIQTTYLVCATPRSGSGMLCGALANAIGAGHPDEWFARSLIHHNLGEWGLRDDASTPVRPRPKPGVNYLEHVLRAATVNRVLSLKVHWYQLQWIAEAGIVPDLLSGFPASVRQNVRILMLRREDRVAQAVSTIIADATGVYYQLRGCQPAVARGLGHLKPQSPRYDFEALLKIVREIIRDERYWYAWFSSRRLAHFCLTYELMCANYHAVMRQAMDYLGLQSQDVPTPISVPQAGLQNLEFAERFRNDFRRLGYREADLRVPYEDLPIALR
jgi:trehalose 2-sulfotransferase